MSVWADILQRFFHHIFSASALFCGFFFFFNQRLERVDPNVPSPRPFKETIMVCWELEVIRMFFRQFRSRAYGVFEVGRPSFERLCLSGRTIHHIHRRVSSSQPFFASFFFFFNKQPEKISPDVPLPRPFEEELMIWSLMAQVKRLWADPLHPVLSRNSFTEPLCACFFFPP